MNPILVIGGTGNVGRHVVSQLVDAGVPVRAFVRNPGAANLPPAVHLVRGDLTDPATIEPALDGVDSIFLVWTAPEATFAGVLGRIARTARRIVFLSAPLKTPHPFFQQPNPNRDRVTRYERLIEDSGLDWTFLRPGMFAVDAIGFWAPQIRAGDRVRWPYLDVPTSPIDERDIAAVGVRALTTEGHAGAEYVITGAESLTQRELILIIGRALNRELQIDEIPPGEALEALTPILSAPVAKLLLDAWAAGVGLPAWVTNTFAEVVGRPPRTFAQWTADHVAAFRA